MSDKESQVRVFKANMMLQAKVGSGPLDGKSVERAQDVMDKNDIDFTPLATGFLDELKEAIAQAKSDDVEQKKKIQDLTQPVMQLKANAKTFRYTLVGNMANIMLSFLEAIKTLDKDAIAIVAAHHTTLSAIVLKKMSGDGGTYGEQLEEELKNACTRYFKKRA